MAGSSAGESTGAHGFGALMAVLPRFFITYRIPVRLVQVLAADGGARTNPWRLAAAVFALFDLATWARMRKHPGFAFKSRLVIDCFDIGFWSLATYVPPNRYWIAVFSGAPLSIEAGVRRPKLAFVFPATALATTTIARAVAGRPFLPLAFSWLFLAATCGVTLSHYDSALRRQAKQDWLRRREADDRRAYLAGQNSVAMGASSVVDGIEGVVPLLGRPRPGSALWRLADGWKSDLGDSTRTEGAVLGAAYLGDVVKQWEVDYNRHPDLSAPAFVHVSEGAGTTVLTGTQITAVYSLLDERFVPGAHAIELPSAQTRAQRPGRSFSIVIDGDRVVVRADRGRPFRDYDPGPAAFFVMALLAVGDVVQMHPPLPVWAGCLALYGVAAVTTHQRLRRADRFARPGILVLASIAAVGMTTAMSLTARRTLNPAGAGLFPMVPELNLLAILTGMYAKSVPKRFVALAGASALGVLASAWLLHPGVWRPNDFFLNLLWPLCALLSALKFAGELERAQRAYSRDFVARDAAEDNRSYERGRGLVIDLVRQARDDAYAQLASLEPELPRERLGAARAKLSEVDRRLARI